MLFDASTLDTARFIARQLANGALVTLEITFFAQIVVVVMSFVIALMRLSPWRALRWIATVYVEILRGISALVLLFYLFFILPLFGITLAPMTTGIARIMRRGSRPHSVHRSRGSGRQARASRPSAGRGGDTNG